MEIKTAEIKECLYTALVLLISVLKDKNLLVILTKLSLIDLVGLKTDKLLFLTIFNHIFAIYANFLHKTEVQTAILRFWAG